MAKSNLRTIIDLSNINPEEAAKIGINLAKSQEQEHNRGFATAVKNAGLATSLKIQDSVEKRESELPEISEEEAEEVEEVRNIRIEEVDDSTTEVDPQPSQETKSESTSLTPEMLREFLNQSVENAIAPLKQQLDQVEQEKETLKSQLSEAKQSQNILEGLGKLIGKSETTPQKGSSVDFPNVNTKLSPNRDRIDGRLAEFMSVRDASGVKYRQGPKGSVPMYPTYKVDSWMSELKKDRKAFRDFLENEMTDFGKKHGFFRGSRMVTEGEMRAATTASDIPGGFLEVLSSIMRINARPGLVFWQFPVTVHQYDRGEGDTIQIPRAAYPAIATDSNERLLSGGNTYVPIDNSNQRVRTGIVRMNLNEYGRGRSEAPPISIPTFVEQYSMLPLMRILERDLFYDYYNWEDLIIREQWRPTSKAYYNSADEVVTAASSVTVGGQLTRKFLGAVYTKMANDRVVPLPDGNYGLVTNPTAIRQLKNDMDQYWLTPTEDQLQDLTNMFLLDYPNGEDLKIQNYRGLYEGFHIFETNSFANGGAGTEGVATETDGNSDSLTFRTSYAFGYAASGRGMGGSGVQILFDEKTDFGRIDRAIWQSYEAHGPLDVDATGYNDTSDVPQETRVFKVVTSDQVSAA